MEITAAATTAAAAAAAAATKHHEPFRPEILFTSLVPEWEQTLSGSDTEVPMDESSLVASSAKATTMEVQMDGSPLAATYFYRIEQ